MTSLSDLIIREAQERISNGRILSGGNLTSFLQAASYRDGEISERELIDAAIQHGLYADLGSKYQSQLDDVIDQAILGITTGALVTGAELRTFLESEAPKVSGGRDPYKVERDLLIEARQKGLYEFLPEFCLPKALTFDWEKYPMAAVAAD